MAVLEIRPIKDNESVVELYKIVLDLFGSKNQKYGDLASRIVCLLGMMLILETEYPKLREQYQRILSDLSRAQNTARIELELTNRQEMESLGLI